MKGLLTNIQGYSIHDGPGIRTTVFLKGCSLECRWCSNPECISLKPEVGIYESLCSGCGKCAGVCPTDALIYTPEHAPRINRALCTGCGLCASACAYQALVIFGRMVDTEEVFQTLIRDRMFYDSSGGGVTVSGGECLLQPEFVCDLLYKCRQNNIHTCIETSGHAPQSAMRNVLEFTDEVLFDLKHQNVAIHQEYTGQTNNLILSNARIAAASGVEMIFRMPLIPGVNDDQRNINETAAFIISLSLHRPHIELMPYHRLGKGKYDALERPFLVPGLVVPGLDNIELVQKTFRELGVECSVSN